VNTENPNSPDKGEVVALAKMADVAAEAATHKTSPHNQVSRRSFYQVSWSTLPGLRGIGCSDFRATETAAPDNERGVAVEISSVGERDVFLAELEAHFAAQRFSNNAAAFEAVKTYILERVAQHKS
jgi:hypothetical protein